MLKDKVLVGKNFFFKIIINNKKKDQLDNKFIIVFLLFEAVFY